MRCALLYGILVALLPTLHADVHTLSLQQAIAIALKQNPDLLLARLDQQRAQLTARSAKDPFLPKVYAGSGLAWTYGYPLSIEGSAPSIVQVKAIMSVYNQPARYQLAQSKEDVRTAALDEAAKRDEVAYRVAVTYLETNYLARAADAAGNQAASFKKVADTVQTRVAEGRELPVEKSRAEVNLLRAQQRLRNLEADLDYSQNNLAVLLGYAPSDRVRTSDGGTSSEALPESEASAVDTALANSKEVKRIESQIQAKGFETKSYHAQKLPKVDLVAQYGLFSRFNNFQQFFQRFQQNNATVGLSIQIPIVAPAAARALANRGDVEMERLRVEMTSTRDRLALQTRRAWLNLQRAQDALKLAQADLDLAREQLNVVLSQFGEGRTLLRQLEETRTLENERWITLYDAGLALERARLDLLRQTGGLLAAIR
ncbi:MAG TPA: TolC family protein [Bryobacteraceae bacterium]|jgi:outer membrane protein TolC|nr:TolC family protein [Bryobacteraceae bacterium]